jgi:hypothetical protein
MVKEGVLSRFDFTAGTVTDLDLETGLPVGDPYPIPERLLGLDASIAEAERLAPQMAARSQAMLNCRAALGEAVNLAALSPYPTPEEQAIIDTQVSSALALFRAIMDPPADLTALAAAVLTLKV